MGTSSELTKIKRRYLLVSSHIVRDETILVELQSAYANANNNIY